MVDEAGGGGDARELVRSAGMLSRCNEGLLRLVGDGVVELDAWVPEMRRSFEKAAWEEDMEFVSKHLAGKTASMLDAGCSKLDA